MTDLLDIVQYVKPTALMGLSTVKGAFSEAVIRRMASQTPRPIVFPLSNPLQLSECTFSEALGASDGSVLFASGSPFPTENFGGRRWEPGQGNNMYIFPGASASALRVFKQCLTVAWTRSWTGLDPLSRVICDGQHGRSIGDWTRKLAFLGRA